jgi:hypothetical protein
MREVLDCGRYYGSVLRRADLGPVLLTETPASRTRAT